MTTELIYALRLGAQISRERNLNLDYAIVADQAADTIERLELEALAATLRIENDKAEIDELRTELAALKQQEPIGMIGDPARTREVIWYDHTSKLPVGTLFYLAAGAKPKEQS